MKKTLLLALLVVAPACNLFLDRDGLERPAEPSAVRQKGDEALARGQLGTALALYERTLATAPADPQAAVGSALMQTLLLPSSAPVNELFDACGQPRFDVERLLFAADGLLARDELARQGSGDVQVLMGQQSQSFGNLGFEPDHVRSFLEHRDDGRGVHNELSVRATDLRLGDSQYPASLEVRFNVDDVFAGDDATIIPLADGLVIDVARFSGTLTYQSETRWLSRATTGTVTFHGGKNVGDSFSLDIDITGIGCVANGDAPSTCDQEMRITGTLSDVVSAPLRLPDEDVPFGTLEDQEGPPHVSWTIQAIERCGSQLTTDFVAQKAKALVPYLEAIVARLDVALGPDGPVAFTLPRSMLHTDEDLVLGRTDLLALRGTLHLAAAAVELATAYRYLDGPLVSLIGTANACVSEQTVYNTTTASWETHPVIAAARDFLAGPVVENLAGTLLSRAAGFDLERARAHLDAGLADAAAALRSRANSTRGLLDFQAPRASVFSTQVAEQADAIRQSIRSVDPVTLPRNPLYRIHLKAFFDNPLDRGRLLQLTGLTALARVESGDPLASYCSQYNDEVDVLEPMTVGELQAWSGGAFFGPADLSTQACGPSVACPEGYTCSDPAYGGVCGAGPTYNATEIPVWEAVFEQDWPAFVLPGAQRLIDSWE